MIRAAGETATGRPFILLGLSQVNWERLRADEPIRFAADELGFAGDVVIVGGTTEAAIEEDMRAYGMLSPTDTRIHRRPNEAHPGGAP